MAKFVLTEDMNNEMVGSLLTESFYPVAEKVLIVKEYLDKNIRVSMLDDIDENGYPKTVMCFNMTDSKGNAIKTLMPNELLVLLDDKFIKMISDKNDRRNFLKQVITDWCRGNIKNDGMLSVNTIK